jgi:hypothetical protein
MAGTKVRVGATTDYAFRSHEGWPSAVSTCMVWVRQTRGRKALVNDARG